MKSWTPSTTFVVLLCGVYIFTLFSHSSLFTAASQEEEHDRLNCRKLMTGMGKKMFKLFGKCTKEMRSQYENDTDFSAHINCVVKCVLSKLELIDGGGKMTNATLKGFLDKQVPAEFHEVGFILVEGCLEDFVHILDHGDEFCVSYGDFAKCLQNSLADFADICKGR